jgi:hypothetical protein
LISAPAPFNTVSLLNWLRARQARRDRQPARVSLLLLSRRKGCGAALAGETVRSRFGTW